MTYVYGWIYLSVCVVGIRCVYVPYTILFYSVYTYNMPICSSFIFVCPTPPNNKNEFIYESARYSCISSVLLADIRRWALVDGLNNNIADACRGKRVGQMAGDKRNKDGVNVGNINEIIFLMEWRVVRGERGNVEIVVAS